MFVPERKGIDRSPDLLIEKGRRSWAVECKRTGRSGYARDERQAGLKMSAAVHELARDADLRPSGIASGIACPDQKIGTFTCKRMEQGVIGSAHAPFQVGLAWPHWTGLGEPPCRSDQVVRHGLTCDLLLFVEMVSDMREPRLTERT